MVVGAIIAVLVAPGCAGLPRSDDPGSAAERTTTDAVSEYPTPPATLGNDTVERVALAHEEAFIERRLRNASGLSDVSLGPATVTERAVVVNRTDGGAYVEVRHPYSYQYSEGVADLSTEALYFVDGSAIERVRGQDVELPD